MLAFNRRATTYEQEAFVQKQMAIHLANYISENIPCQNVLEFGCGTALLTELLLQKLPIKKLLLNDLSPEMLQVALQKIAPYQKKSPLSIETNIAPIEDFSFPLASFDLIASSATLQWITKVDSLLAKIAQALKPKAFLLLSSFGEKNLWQLRKLTGRGLDYIPLEPLKTQIEKAGLKLIKAQEEEVIKYFPSMKKLFRHLQLTGVNNLSSTKETTPLLSPRELVNLSMQYEKLYRTPQGIPLSYHPLYFFAQKL